MMWRLGEGWKNEEALAATWRSASPFPHLVFDDVLAPDALAELMAVLEEEAIEHYENDIYSFDASPPTAISDSLRRVRDDFGATFAAALTRITGKAVTRADMRAYAYRAGHFLLPHSDHQMGVGRQLAYAYYAPSPDPPQDGALELYRCDLEDGEIVRAESARIIEPRANRMAIFDVSDASLHQVREVLGGLRVSLAGWFYA
jgi:Rps23 Pro-64 3,4-dihydroxylase Tpa1-like proline 4-hydroxylase